MRPLQRPWLSLVVLASGCLPGIAEVAADDVRARPGTEARRGVELCVLVQEHFTRPLVVGVSEWSLDDWQFATASIVVKHPAAGLVVIDPAFGTTLEADLARAGPAFTVLSGSARTKRPLVEVMAEAGLAPNEVRYALVTHTHWDHVGALRDLPNARVLLSAPEAEFSRHLSRFTETGVMPHHLAGAKERLYSYSFSGPARDGFAASYDVFGDGAIVALPLPGHTPGSAGYLVTDRAGHRWLFSGDATWTVRGVERPAHKNPLARIDQDLGILSHTVGVLHALAGARPDLTVVPAHDAKALLQLPECGK